MGDGRKGSCCLCALFWYRDYKAKGGNKAFGGRPAKELKQQQEES